MKWYNKQIQNFLSPYAEKNFVRYKKAQYTLIFSVTIVSGLMALNLFALLKLNPQRIVEIFKPSVFLALSCIIIMILVRKGRVEIAANVLAFTACFIAIGGFLDRSVHLAGASMGVFMHVDMVYTTLYCSPVIATLVFTAFAGTHIFYYYFIAVPVAEGILVQTARSTMVDGIITLALIYVVGSITGRFLNQAVDIAEKESTRSRENYSRIKSLIAAIKNTILELNHSVGKNHGITNIFSDNAQSEAASMEELSATIEEISAGTENVTRAAGEQNTSIEDLIQSINNLSLSIDQIEEHGNLMKDNFVSFMVKAEKGSQSSSRLDRINRKILKNSNDITEVITIIEQFFDKINLLSLNATIEAARAGEHGKGFAVVAEEIGKLADNSQQELNRIGELIAINKRDSAESNEVINQILGFIRETTDSIESLQEISITTIKALEEQRKLKNDMDRKAEIAMEKTEHISMSMKEQSIAIEGIAQSIEDTSKIVQVNAENTKELQSGSEQLKELSASLENKINES